VYQSVSVCISLYQSVSVVSVCISLYQGFRQAPPKLLFAQQFFFENGKIIILLFVWMLNVAISTIKYKILKNPMSV
jgi:hypothetical protein